MTAPAAPVIRAWQTTGGLLRLSWEAVFGATSYNVYLGDAQNPTGLEDQVLENEASADGSFVWYSPVQVGTVYVRITAVNALAEESGYSNQKTTTFMGQSSFDEPTPARRKAVKTR